MIRLLIADDEDDVRLTIRDMIPWKENGIEVIADVSNGIAALEVMEKHKPDVALMDVRMPGMDGIQVARAVFEQRMGVKIIFLSGYDEFHFAREGIRYGIADYLLKPCPPQEILQSIQKCCRCEEEPEKPLRTAQSHAAIEQATAYIEMHYAESVDLNTVANAVFVTPAYLSLLFRQQLNITFSDYLNQVRIQHACELLKQPRLKIYQIALRVGYNDAKYFARTFKRMIGCTPQEYRS